MQLSYYGVCPMLLGIYSGEYDGILIIASEDCSGSRLITTL